MLGSADGRIWTTLVELSVLAKVAIGTPRCLWRPRSKLIPCVICESFTPSLGVAKIGSGLAMQGKLVAKRSDEPQKTDEKKKGGSSQLVHDSVQRAVGSPDTQSRRLDAHHQGRKEV